MARTLPRSLWGVALCGVANCVLWERGSQWIGAGIWVHVAAIAAVSIVAGAVTPEKPHYTAIALAVGSVLPLSDVPPISNGLLPILGIWDSAQRHTPLTDIIVSVLAGSAMAGGATAIMFCPYRILVQIGWVVRRKITLLRG